MISEIWITPDKFVDRNTPYGLYVYKKDLINKVNWCLLYKIQMKSNMMRDYVFLGWVEVPLHTNDKLRKEYNRKKNAWISDEITGKGDKRTVERKKASMMLAKDPDFSKMSVSGKQFALSKSQQISLLEDYVTDGRIQAFNELEKYRIVDEARMIVMKGQWKKNL
jgi:hypothetical protein